MFVEEKPSLSGQRGIELWRSAPGLLTGWTYVGRVLDRAVSGWDSQDRTSPTVFHDGDQLIMLYEGRSSTQAGRIGRAVSHVSPHGADVAGSEAAPTRRALN